MYSSYCNLIFSLQVNNEKVHFVWVQFSELNAFLKKQAEDDAKLKETLAEMIALITCKKLTRRKKSIKCQITSELKDTLHRLNTRVKALYTSLPTNTMIIICTGHGDTAVVQRYTSLNLAILLNSSNHLFFYLHY